MNENRTNMLTINAEIRKDQGTGASRRLRLANKFPAILYGGKEAPITIKIEHRIIINYQNLDHFYREVIYLVINGQKTTVKVQAVQRHPFKRQLLHIDFIRTY